MREAIKNFAEQFNFKAVVENKSSLKPAKKVVLGGMGGSHLAGDIIKMVRSDLDFQIHSDYGLPRLLPEDLKERLFIASSYSGNTEETIDFAEKAFENKLNLAIIATGGKLLEFAKKNNVPYVVLPSEGIQPRMALGFSFLAISKLLGPHGMCDELSTYAKILKPETLEEEGKNLANALNSKVPIICSSTSNGAVAYNWKIKFNETGKIPAFCSVFPELNHNEMTGFDIDLSTKDLSSRFHFIFLKDDKDNPRTIKRMDVCEQLYKARGLGTTSINFNGSSTLERIFNSLLLADWTAYHSALLYGVDSENVPMVEEFKKLIAE